jgi:uncharacterized protein YPO0396
MKMESSKNVTLYQLTSDLVALDELLQRVTEGEEEAAEELNKEVLQLVQNKTDSIVYFDEYMEDTLDIIEKRIKDLRQLKQTIENKKESFGKYVLHCMGNLGTSELRGQIKKIKVMPPSKSVEIENIDLIPAEFLKVKKEILPMKVEIAKAIKSGQEVAGAKLVEGMPRVKLSNITL